MIKKRANPPKGSFSKNFNKKWDKYYEEALEKTKNKTKAAIIAWSRIKHKFEKSEKSERWILKKKKK